MYLWGNGRYGQLAGTGANLTVPTLAPSLSQTQQVVTLRVRTHSSSLQLPYNYVSFRHLCCFVIKVVCGQNCSFLIQSNGAVMAVGEGQYGRLGQGNSDDLYVPTIISAFQGK